MSRSYRRMIATAQRQFRISNPSITLPLTKTTVFLSIGLVELCLYWNIFWKYRRYWDTCRRGKSYLTLLWWFCHRYKRRNSDIVVPKRDPRYLLENAETPIRRRQRRRWWWIVHITYMMLPPPSLCHYCSWHYRSSLLYLTCSCWS